MRNNPKIYLYIDIKYQALSHTMETNKVLGPQERTALPFIFPFLKSQSQKISSKGF